MSKLPIRERRVRTGDIAGIVVWVIAMTLWTTLIDLRNRDTITVDQFTVLNYIVAAAFLFGVYLRWRLNRARPGNS